MSIGQAPSQPPPPPPLEYLLWRVSKHKRIAEARLRVLAHGREFRVTVDDRLFFSRLFRDDEDGRKVGDESAETLDNFLGHGWKQAPESIRPDQVL